MNWLREYFGFTPKEYRGAIVLFALCLAVVAYKIISPRVQQRSNYDFAKEQSLLDSLQLVLERAEELDNANKEKKYKKKYADKIFKADVRKTNKPLSLFEFDPNKVSKSELEKIGLQESVIKGLLNFRKSGGKFYQQEDFKKLYTVNDSLYEVIKPFLVFESKPVVERKPINLNAADTSALKSLNGVGSYYAKKIVEYRELLGGYQNINQLLEIWRLDSGVIVKNKHLIIIDVGLIKRLNVNKISKEELKQHPYIGYKVANVIVNYRTQHGSYKSLKQLLETGVIDAALLNKLEPYLTIE